MKLHYSPASPFARKAWVTAIECGFGDRLELAATNPHESTPALVAANPFSKVPALELDDGEIVIESLLICEYLDDMAGGGIVFPKDRAERLAMLRRHAVANGLMEVSVLRRVESLRARDPDRDKNIARQAAIGKRVLNRLEADAGSLGDARDLANLSLAIALDYLDFRFASDAWRESRPKLAAWHDRYSKRDSLQSTMPK
ncbi:MAG TPA: glutathione S-transferase family protein [Burkholderiales bacterium]|nr:glutathione S-transferase family protein [Burkholderiales bacterium]